MRLGKSADFLRDKPGSYAVIFVVAAPLIHLGKALRQEHSRVDFTLPDRAMSQRDESRGSGNSHWLGYFDRNFFIRKFEMRSFELPVDDVLGGKLNCDCLVASGGGEGPFWGDLELDVKKLVHLEIPG